MQVQTDLSARVMAMMDFNANNSYRLSICVDKSVFTTIETAQCDVQFYLVNSLLSKCLGTFTLGPPVMSSGMSGPGGVPGGGAPGAFAGHPGGGLMGLLSHASVGVTNSQAGGVAAMGGVLGGQQQQHVNMASRARGYSADGPKNWDDVRSFIATADLRNNKTEASPPTTNSDRRTPKVEPVKMTAASSKNMNSDPTNMNTHPENMDSVSTNINGASVNLSPSAISVPGDRSCSDIDPIIANVLRMAVKIDPLNLSSDPRNMDADAQNMNADTRNTNADPNNMNADPRNMNVDTRNMNADLRNMNVDSSNMHHLGRINSDDEDASMKPAIKQEIFRKSYSLEFKKEVIAHAEENGGNNRKTAEVFGINEKQVREWRRSKNDIAEMISIRLCNNPKALQRKRITGRSRPRNTYSSRKRTITLKRQKPPPAHSIDHRSVSMVPTQVPVPPQYNTGHGDSSPSGRQQVSSMLSALDREHVNIISDDDDFEIQEINSKDSPKLSRPQTQTPLSAASTSTCRPTDLSTRNSNEPTSYSQSDPKKPKLDLLNRNQGSNSNPEMRSPVDENLDDTGVETMTMVGQILDAVQGTQDLSSYFIKSQPEDEFVPDRVVSLNSASPVRPVQSLLNPNSLSQSNQSQLSSSSVSQSRRSVIQSQINDSTEPASSQSGFIVESASCSNTGDNISDMQRLLGLSNEVKVECNEVNSCHQGQQKQQEDVSGTDVTPPSIVNVSSMSDAEQGNSAHGTLPAEEESEDAEITDVIISTPDQANSSSSSAQQTTTTTPPKTVSCEICEYKTTSVKRMRLHYNYAHGAEVDEEKLT